MMANKITQAEKLIWFAWGRGLMADPNMPKKAMQGRFDDIRTCSLGYEVHRIGGCLEARRAKEAIDEGMVLGCSI